VCSDSTHPHVSINARFAAGGSVGPLALGVENGDFSISGALGGLEYAYASTDHTSCNSAPQTWEIIPEHTISMTGLCPTWSEPLRTCEWSTVVPGVNFSYYFKFEFFSMAGNAAATGAYLRMNKDENLLHSLHLRSPKAYRLRSTSTTPCLRSPKISSTERFTANWC
jgi:hypothetical protein